MRRKLTNAAENIPRHSHEVLLSLLGGESLDVPMSVMKRLALTSVTILMLWAAHQ